MNGAEKHAEIIDEYGSYENYLQHIDEYHKTEQKAKEQAKEQEKEQTKKNMEIPSLHPKFNLPIETQKLKENNYLVIIMTKTGQTHILNINAINYANAEKMASLFPTLKEIIQITLFN
jgi:beta-lactamase superfamily II metal-dependent hydrolase